jgi:hypothetical protein
MAEGGVRKGGDRREEGMEEGGYGRGRSKKGRKWKRWGDGICLYWVMLC